MRKLLIIPLLALAAACQPEDDPQHNLKVWPDVDLAVLEGDSLYWLASSNADPDDNPDWSITNGSLPPGLTLTELDNLCEITGNATTAGDYLFTLRLESAGKVKRVDVLLRVAPLTGPLTIYTPEFATAVAGNYSFDIIATGGTGTGYNYSIVSGALPAGLAINQSVSPARLEGFTLDYGTFNFTIQLTDSGANMTTASYTLKVIGVN